MVMVVSLFVGFFTALKMANAQTVPDYARTPSGSEIVEGTSINFSGFATFSSNASAIRVRADSYYTPCLDIPNFSDEVEFDIDNVLPLGDYSSVYFLGYLGTDDECEDPPQEILVESGSPAFSVVESDVLGCTDPSAENYDPDANTDDGSCIYSLTFADFMGGILVSFLGGIVSGIILNKTTQIFIKSR